MITSVVNSNQINHSSSSTNGQNNGQTNQLNGQTVSNLLHPMNGNSQLDNCNNLIENDPNQNSNLTSTNNTNPNCTSSKWQAALANTNNLLNNNLINNNLINNNLINNNLLSNNLINNFNNFLPSQLHHHHPVNHHLVNHQLANHHSMYSIDSKSQIF